MEISNSFIPYAEEESPWGNEIEPESPLPVHFYFFFFFFFFFFELFSQKRPNQTNKLI